MTKSSNFSQSSKSNHRRSTILRRKEKDSRNSSLPRRTFLGRVVRRGGVWMLPHRSDTSRGHLHPPTHPRLTLPPFLHPSCSSVSTSQPHRQGGFSRAAAYAATFLGALARDFLPSSSRHPVFPSLQLPGLLSRNPPVLVAPLDDATAIVYASNLSTRKRNESVRLRWGAVVYTIFLTFDRTRSNLRWQCARGKSRIHRMRKSKRCERRCVRSRFFSRSICVYLNKEYLVNFVTFT